MEVPERPMLFAKFSNTLCGHEDPIVLPSGIGHVDAEAELAMVIGETGRNLSERNALDVVEGWTCANDVSAREAQFSDGQWFRGKGYDTFCPIGPTIVPRRDLDPSNLLITQRVNGLIIQQSRTSQLLFSLVDLLVFVSSVLTLEPGDLVLTGTPPGVGYFRTPPHQLSLGDVVEVEIEGVGLLRNPVAAGDVRRVVPDAALVADPADD